MNIKRLVEILPFIIGFLIFNGFLKLYIYYNNWNVNIIDFLDFSEIILSFLNDLNIIIFCLIFFIFHQLIGAKLLEGKIDIESIKNSIDNNKKKFLLFCLFIFSCFISLFLYYNKIFLLYMAIASLFQFLIYFLEHLISDDENTPLILATTLTFISFTICLSNYEIKNTNSNSKLATTRIKINDEQIVTSENLILIGKTQKFIYLYNKNRKLTRIIPTDRILNIEIEK